MMHHSPWTIINVFSLLKRRQEQREQATRHALLLQHVALLQLLFQRRATDYTRTQQSIQHYEHVFYRVKQEWHIIRQQLYRATVAVERLIHADQWVTAKEHERLYQARYQWVTPLCAARAKLHQYHALLLTLSQQATEHAAHLLGIERALLQFAHELERLQQQQQQQRLDKEKKHSTTRRASLPYHRHHHYRQGNEERERHTPSLDCGRHHSLHRHHHHYHHRHDGQQHNHHCHRHQHHHHDLLLQDQVKHHPVLSSSMTFPTLNTRVHPSVITAK